MDSLDLLARENEFKKLNKQLEKKTESLMKEIEQVMQKQDFFTEFSHNLSLNTSVNHPRKHYCDVKKQPETSSTPVKPALRKQYSNSTKNTNLQFDSAKMENMKDKSDTDCIQSTNNCKNCANNSKNCTNDCKNCTSDCKKCANNCKNYTNDCKYSANNCKNCTNDCKNCTNNCNDYTTNDLDCTSDMSSTLYCTNHTKITCDCYSVTESKKHDGMEFLHAFVSVNVQEKVLPPSFLKEKVTIESICKFLSSKIKLMQEQMDKLQAALDKKAAQCKVHLTMQAELEGERMSLLNNAQNCRTAADTARAKCTALENKLNEKDRLYKEQRSEADKLLSEVKRLRSKNANVEAKCSSQEEAIENLKQQLEIVKRGEKEFRDSSRTLSASHQNAICRLEERVKTLTACIDKQAALIDNLRRQNAILMTEGAVKALEREYCNFLTQD